MSVAADLAFIDASKLIPSNNGCVRLDYSYDIG